MGFRYRLVLLFFFFRAIAYSQENRIVDVSTLHPSLLTPHSSPNSTGTISPLSSFSSMN
jgi:hypothetical protein